MKQLPYTYCQRVFLRLRAFLLLTVLLVASCAAPAAIVPSPTVSAPATSTSVPASSAPVAPTATTVSSGSAPTSTVGAPAVGGDWPTYHRDNARTGFDPAIPSSTSIAPGWRSSALDGDVYAEPLVVGGFIYVATENNTVYRLDRATGKVVWQAHLGEPIARSQLPCGDIDITGITSTPVVDPTRGLIYAVTFVQPGRHELVALDLEKGDVRFRQPIDPSGANPLTHQQRSALSLAGDAVYVALGGLYGDCGDYHGWVMAANASDGKVLAQYQVPTQREGAIWAPSGPAIDAAGNVYVSTGNGSSVDPATFDFGDAVLRLSPELKLLDWFAPANWVDLNRTDADIGSVGPALLGGGTIFQIGKAGEGYLLHADALGHVNGQAFEAKVCGASFGGTAFQAPSLYVPCTNSLVALNVPDGSSFSTRWAVPMAFAGPPIIAGGVVWTIARDGTLYGVDPADGHVLSQTPVGTPTHFATPSASGRQLFVAAGRVVLAFNLG
jgi:outer membrane protein assembly factor BamB